MKNNVKTMLKVKGEGPIALKGSRKDRMEAH